MAGVREHVEILIRGLGMVFFVIHPDGPIATFREYCANMDTHNEFTTLLKTTLNIATPDGGMTKDAIMVYNIDIGLIISIGYLVSGEVKLVNACFCNQSDLRAAARNCHRDTIVAAKHVTAINELVDRGADVTVAWRLFNAADPTDNIIYSSCNQMTRGVLRQFVPDPKSADVRLTCSTEPHQLPSEEQRQRYHNSVHPVQRFSNFVTTVSRCITNVDFTTWQTLTDARLKPSLGVKQYQHTQNYFQPFEQYIGHDVTYIILDGHFG